MKTLFETLRRKNGAKKTPPQEPITLRELFSGKRRSEVIGIAWWAFSLFLIAAFWPHVAGRNALGPTGEILFRLGFALLGVLVYLLPIATATYGLILFKTVEVERSSYKLLGLGLLLLTLAILVELVFPQPIQLDLVKSFYSWKGAGQFWNNLPELIRFWGKVSLPAGGMPAEIAARFLVTIFSVVGTYIVCGTFFILSLYFLELEPYLARLIERFRHRMQNTLESTRQVSGKFEYAPPSGKTAKKGKADANKPAIAVTEERPKIKISTPPPIPAGLTVSASTDEQVKPAGRALKPEKNGKPEQFVLGEIDAPTTPVVEERHYDLPSIDLLTNPTAGSRISESFFEEMSQTLEKALAQFGVSAKVVEVCPGPVVTRYELEPSPGVKVNRIVSLADDISLAMKAEHVRIEAPIPGKGAVGIEIPNQQKQVVVLKEMVANPEFPSADSILTFAVGKDIGGKQIFAALDTMPHLLVAGATGSGKSACLNAIISSLLYRATPNDVKFIMIDPKRVELTMYNGIPHLKTPVITDSREAAVALKFMVKEMEDRYRLFADIGVRDIKAYNEKIRETQPEGKRRMPYVIIFIDELADLMMVAANEVEAAICRLAQMARGVGIHMVLATQRPSVDVITGVIKANFPSRIAFQVSSKVDSRTILDANGADALLGRGDMLYAPASATKPLRVQGVYISTAEVEQIVKFWRGQGDPVFDLAFSREKLKASTIPSEEGGEDDTLYDQAKVWVIRAKSASTSMLQRRLKIGYSRAARLIDLMEERGIVGPPDGSKPRRVLVKPEEIGLAEPEDVLEE